MGVQIIITIAVDILLAVGIVTPLVVQLVKYIKESIKEKNWTNLVKMLLTLIETAEEKFQTGAERKEWVVDMVKAAEKEINIDIDEEQLSKLIDDLVEMTKKVNIK